MQHKVWLTQLLERAEQGRCRYVVTLCGAPHWQRQLLLGAQSQIAKVHPSRLTPLIGPDLMSLSSLTVVDGCLVVDSDTVTTSESRRLLGREFALVVLTGKVLPGPDLLAIVAGTLRGGGLLMLTGAMVSKIIDSPSAAFDRWLSRKLKAGAAVLPLIEGDAPPPLPQPVAASAVSTDELGCLNPEQRKVVNGVLQVVHGHRRRPLVVMAERGRGKTSALGIAAAKLLGEGRSLILVTSPKRAAVDALFQQALRLLPDADLTKDNLNWQQGQIAYLAPDQLLTQLPDASLLLVDEAAAIPAPLLTQMLARYSRIVFSTTTHGYEGTGRGFSVRFRRQLDSLTPGWQQLTLTTPARWVENDPLERWLYQTLLLDAEPADAELLEACAEDLNPAQLPLECWSGEQLLQQPKVLQQLFGLLVLAHYQTTPNDLRDLLQGPGMRVWLVRQQGLVVAGLLCVAEGPLPVSLARSVWLGQRRPPGHLLPQTLIAQSGWLEAGELSYQRVVRIAVHPALQGSGLGRHMLSQLVANESDGDLIGSSFAASDHLPRFWFGAGFRGLRLGHRRDSASGCHSLLVARPVSERGAELVERVSARFAGMLMDQLPSVHADVDPDLVADLLLQLPPNALDVYGSQPLDAQDRLDIVAYVLGGRGFEQVAPVLRKFVRCHLNNGLAAEGRALLIQRILQAQSIEHCCRVTGLPGRRQLEARVRQLLMPLVRSAVLPLLPAELRGHLTPLLES